MVFTNLDTIAKRYLLENGLSIHWYVEALTLSSSALRELSQLKLPVVHTVKLPVNNYFAVDLPADCTANSLLGVFLPAGQWLAPVQKDDTITPLRNRDSSGAFVPFGNPNTDDTAAGGGTWHWNQNDWGEHTGGQYGGSGAPSHTWKLIRERRQIQLSETFSRGTIVVKYVGGGLSATAASEVDPEAWAAIQAYIAWKRSPNRDLKDSGEARTFYNELRLLGAKQNDLSVSDILNIVRGSYRASPKS